MNQFKLLGLIAVASVASTFTSANECGQVTIADMNWSSASLLANVDKIILSEGYGCEADLLPGDTMPTSASMIEKGQPDIAPELWTNALKDVLDRAVEEKKVRYAGKSLSDGGEEGFWVPQYMVDEYPEMATIEGVIKHAELFENPENPDMSMFMGCPAGWNCQISASNLYQALNLEEAGFELVDPGSGAGLSGSIAKAYERKEAWFGYYWAPTALLGKYKMVKVDFGSGVDADHYRDCIGKPDCEDPQVTMYPPSAVWTVVSEEFASKSPEVVAYLNRRSVTNSLMNELLAWMEDNQADGEYGAYHFLETQEGIWSEWVSEDVAAKIKAAL